MTRPRSKWNGRTIRAAVRYLIAKYGRTCWLCRHHIAGTVSLDHVHPVSTHPELEHDPLNWRPAHLTKAGTDQGCTIPGCRCPGNKGRKAKAWTAPPSRSWT